MPFTGATQSFVVDPGSSGAFTNGVWTGNVVISQPASAIKLNANNGSGIVGESSAFDVVSTPLLRVRQADAFACTGWEGGPFSPQTATFTVSNDGTSPMAWAVSNSATWLTLTPASGTLPVGASADVTATFNDATVILPAGTYLDNIAFANTSNGVGNTTRPVSLLISFSAYRQWLKSYSLSTDTPPASSLANDGIPNLIKAALGLDPRVSGHQGRLQTTKREVDGKNYLTLEFTTPEPPPVGLTYQVETTASLTGWGSVDTCVVSSTVTNGLRTVIVRDAKAMDDNDRRFIRLHVIESP